MKKQMFQRDFNAFKASLLVVALGAAWALGGLPTTHDDHGTAQLYKASFTVIDLPDCCPKGIDL